MKQSRKYEIILQMQNNALLHLVMGFESMEKKYLYVGNPLETNLSVSEIVEQN